MLIGFACRHSRGQRLPVTDLASLDINAASGS